MLLISFNEYLIKYAQKLCCRNVTRTLSTIYIFYFDAALYNITHSFCLLCVKLLIKAT